MAVHCNLLAVNFLMKVSFLIELLKLLEFLKHREENLFAVTRNFNASLRKRALLAASLFKKATKNNYDDGEI